MNEAKETANVNLTNNIINEYEKLAKTGRFTMGKIYDKLCDKFSPAIREKIKSIVENYKNKKYC